MSTSKMEHQDWSKLVLLCKNLTYYNIGDDDNIKLYALYKQAMFGDCHEFRIIFKDTTDAERYIAWRSLLGKSKYEAMEEYNKLLQTIVQ